ncbi:helix-turn-helix transcriptional regulator [Legionella israelensis]|nr:AlpA family phage regulatory protein [Legionella israelensis]
MKEDLRRVIRWPGLRKMFDDNISRSTIDRWERDKRFPARIKIGKNSVAWNLVEVEQWFKEKLHD